MDVWGESAFDATAATTQLKTVSFPAVDFADTGEMQVFITANRNGTIQTDIMECNGVGNKERTTHSFVARCTKTTSNYGISFSFLVRGFWK